MYGYHRAYNYSMLFALQEISYTKEKPEITHGPYLLEPGENLNYFSVLIMGRDMMLKADVSSK